MKRLWYYQIVLSMKLTLLGMTSMLTETTQTTPGELAGAIRSGNVETCASHATDVTILRTTNVLGTVIWKHLTQGEDLLQDIQEYLQGLSFVVRWIAKTFVMIEYLLLGSKGHTFLSYSQLRRRSNNNDNGRHNDY